MGDNALIINLIIVSLLLMGGVVFYLRYMFVNNVEGAVKRLDNEAEAARMRQSELEKKIDEVDKELAQRKAELNEVEAKLRGQLEEEANAEKQKIIDTARGESEKIISGAQEAAEKMKLEIEKQLDVKVIEFSSQILNHVLSPTAKGLLNEHLMKEFVTKLKDVDMSRIGAEVKTADLISTENVPDPIKSEVATILKGKLNRDIQINSKVDDSVVAGVILQFDSLQLNGSLQDAIKVVATKMKDDRFRD